MKKSTVIRIIQIMIILQQIVTTVVVQGLCIELECCIIEGYNNLQHSKCYSKPHNTSEKYILKENSKLRAKYHHNTKSRSEIYYDALANPCKLKFMCNAQRQCLCM
jgi:hypothetical protein